ncbi:MAG: OadG family transporter subunit [Marinicella sp.]
MDLDASTQLFSQAALLMVTGMGFVFAFLSLLILVIKFVITPLAIRFPDEAKTSVSNNNEPPTQVIAAITAAIKQYRRKHPPGTQ